MATKTKADKSSHTKKELKKNLADKMGSALPEIKTKLGAKKFQRRIKKAAKILMHGLHTKDLENNIKATNGVESSPKKSKGKKAAAAKDNQ